MNSIDFAKIVLFIVVLVAATPLLGRYMTRVFEGRIRWLSPLERIIYRSSGIAAQDDQSWLDYLWALLAFNGIGLVLVVAVLMGQGVLPLNPQHLPRVSWHLAFNTAVSYVTNTNWQSYGGESTLSYLSQMFALTVQNFVSPATGICVLLALIRGLSRRSADGVGHFTVDLTRATLYLLLPLSIIFALVLVWQGVPQNFSAYTDVHTLEGAKQIIAQGPVASQEAIKMLGTNGGGFFNANSAHPFENPTPLTDMLEMWAILLIPAALVYTYGEMVGDRRQGWALYAAMGVLFIGGLAIALWAQWQPNPLLSHLGLNAHLGNFEGVETRFGTTESVLWATVTTDASSGSVNAMHDSLMPLAGMVPMFNMMLGELIYGGVGSGLYDMLLYVLIALFIAGLMVGRTPEYLGKKIEAREVKLLMLTLILCAVGVLGGTAVACISKAGLAGLNNAGPHGFSEMLYAFSSAVGNNGSAFAGLTANTPFYDVMLGLAMLIGRYGFIVPMLAVAGSLAAKKAAPATAGSFPTHGPLFVVLLIGVILIVGGLTFFPALALGPIAEHFALYSGVHF